jgi:type II secretory pathway pseudopilin PulG
MSNRVSTPESGFTLVDVIVGISVLGLVLGSLVTALINLNTANVRAENVNNSYGILKIASDNVNAKNYGILAKKADDGTVDSNPAFLSVEWLALVYYSTYNSVKNPLIKTTYRRVEPTTNATDPTSDLIKVEITVNYTALGAQRTIKDSIYISPYAGGDAHIGEEL